MSVNFGMSPMLYQPAPNPEETYQANMMERMKEVASFEKLRQLTNTLREAEELRERTKIVEDQALTVKQIQEKYGDVLNNVRWDRYLNSRGTVNQSIVDTLYQRQISEAASNAAITAGYGTFTSGVATFLGQLGGALSDPINVAAGLIPVFGTEAAAGLLARAGIASTVATRAGANFVVGAAEDMLINGTFLQPFMDTARSTLGDNPTAQEYFANVAMGGLLGGGFRSFGSLTSDVYAARVLDKRAKAIALTPTEKRISNMSPAEIDTVGKYRMQAEARGVDPDMDLVLDKTQSFAGSSVSATERALAERGVELREGATLRDSDISIRKTPKGYVAETYLEGVKFSARGEFIPTAKTNLANRVQRSLDRNYVPTITKEGNYYVAQYGRDTGKLGQLKGYGYTQKEAIRNLNGLYSEALHNPTGFVDRVAPERAAIADELAQIKALKNSVTADTLETYELGNDTSVFGSLAKSIKDKRMNIYNALQSLTEKYKSDYAQATTKAEKAKLTKAYNAQKKMLEQDLAELKQDMLDILDSSERALTIRELNISNIDKEAFQDVGLTTVEDAQKTIAEMLTYENARIRDEVAETRTNTARNIDYTKSTENLSKYADSLESRLVNSDGFVALPLDEQTRISDSYAAATSDANIMKSAKMKEIFDAFDACERGL